MSVTTTNVRNDFTGTTDPATQYPFTFKATLASWVKVTLAGVLQSSGYTLALNADQDAAPGGYVTFTVAPGAVAVGVYRQIPLTQGTSLSAYSPFPAKTIEHGLDERVLVDQQLEAARATVEAGLAAEAAARIAADAAIVAAGTGAVVDLSACPVTATGTTTTRSLADWMAFALTGILPPAGGDPTPGGTVLMALNAKAAASAYQVGIVRLHKGTGTNVLGGANGEVQHVYLGANVDDRFASVVFKVGGTVVKHRRFNVKSGVSADFWVLLDLAGAGVVTMDVTFGTTGSTTSTDEVFPLWGVDGWERANGHGMYFVPGGPTSTTGSIGEHSVIYEQGKFRIWASSYATGTQDVNVDLFEGTDPTALSWMGRCVVYAARSCVWKDPATGTYYMAHNVFPGQAQIDCRTSPTGDAGSWTLLQANILGAPPAGASAYGNTNFFKLASTWYVYTECYRGGTFIVDLWTGAALTSLTRVGSVSTDGGGGIRTAGPMVGDGAETYSGEYIVLGHSTDLTFPGHSALLPTDCKAYQSAALAGQFADLCWLLRRIPYWAALDGSLHPIPDAFDVAKPTTAASQIGDPGYFVVGGRTYLFYNDTLSQQWGVAGTQFGALAIWDAPISRVLDPAITQARFDDLTAEGWALVSPSTETMPTRYFRKLTEHGSRTVAAAVSPVSIKLQTDANPLNVRRPITLGYDEASFHVLAKTQQTTAVVQVLRADKDLSNNLFNVVFDTGGRLKVYGAATTDLCAYTADTYYDIRVDARTAGFDVWVNGVKLASALAYGSAFARPAYLVLAGPANTTTYINALYVRKLIAAASEPNWG